MSVDYIGNALSLTYTWSEVGVSIMIYYFYNTYLYIHISTKNTIYKPLSLKYYNYILYNLVLKLFLIEQVYPNVHSLGTRGLQL